MGTFLSKALIDFFIAFGVVLGGSILAGIGAVVALQSPVDTMQHISEQLKIWAVVAAVGGTIDPIRVIESNFLDGNLSPVFKQLLYIVVSFIGAHMGTELIQWICRSRI
ncbi:YtrH family sporulation protein [Paenibacillus thiaminolyticus]|uniref:Sporulation protein n=1 Tax=Paenibacillus thiaminolyticus TaxID=49283 RepID=A0AAP9DW15_PANTH|nr:YtrH family sporulation protein [Paenibacillus thiaminolyticus]MCY9535669.1 YtrH family sporulation protein [Paenibacillus thiaminolyticus]MCY9602238.1 YtrH family sporulation protein [Paenibacillus thiaminolyticus]MCY9605902.1 YtrH family sporulation protein [Paenibacillus thiaminolyticus]MCY9612309.1 YtrH family sporulation protein [Paenibacillus thiaminolyticus]MCY9619304.1 YtrH family sporulation protein [Paenibacillus thiaminolyticus]